MRKYLNKIIFTCVLITYAFFFNVNNTKAEEVCSCFYSYGIFNTVGENSTTTTESLSFYQIDYTPTSTTVKRACGHTVIANNLTGSNLVSAIKSKCPQPASDPIDHNNFNINNNVLVNNCTIENCNSVRIYYNEKASNGKVLSTVKTNNSVPLTAIEKDNFETAVEEAEERDEEANNYDDFNDIDPALVIPSDPNYSNNKNTANSYSCALIPPTIMKFLKNFFFLIQVLGIVLLVVMSIIQFVKALTASDDDGLSLAIKNTFKRIIILIILLLLPTLIIWVLNIVNENAYVTDKNGKRIIGENGDPLCKKEYSSINSSSTSNNSNNSTNSSKSNSSTTKDDIYIKEIKDRYTNGLSKVTPNVTIKYKGKLLKKNRDYTVKYKNNKMPGTAQAIIKGKGAYKINKTVKFKLVNIGDDLARATCRVSYSNEGDVNDGHPGTKIYKAIGGWHDCGGGMWAVFSWTGYYDNLWHRNKENWDYIGELTSDLTYTSKDIKVLPGDLLVRPGNFHTLMYVGNKIPREIYKKYLKGTEADLDTPAKSAVFSSAHHSYRGGAGLAISKKKWALCGDSPRSFKVYRIIPDNKNYRHGKEVKTGKKFKTKNNLKKLYR